MTKYKEWGKIQRDYNVKRNKLYETISIEKKRELIDLDAPSRKDSKSGMIKIGKSLVVKESFLLKRPNYKKKHNIFLSEEDLHRHIFISGLTGAGKTNFVKNFLFNFIRKFNVNFLIIQIKNDFDFFKNYFKDLEIYSPGENFSIDIFNPGTVGPLIHAERIFEMFKNTRLIDSSSEFSPQMEKVLVDVLTEVCRSKDSKNWQNFYEICNVYFKNHKHEIPQLAQTLISIKNRIRRFSEGPLKKVFNNKNSIPISKILNNNCILNLNSIIRLGGDKEDIYFFLMLVLKNIWDYNVSAGIFNRLKHLTIVDDATYFMPKESSQNDKISTYLEDIALLQRGTGESLMAIATRPDISENILANSGLVIGFETHFKKKNFAELLNLPEEKYMYLSLLKKGQCIIRTPSIKNPFLLQVPWVKETHISRKSSKVKKKEKNIDMILLKDKRQNKINFKKTNKAIKIKNLNFRLNFTRNCFHSGDYSSCYFICLEIIDYIVDQLVYRLNYKFGGVEKLLLDIEQNNLSDRIKIYPELKLISDNIKNTKQKKMISRNDVLELFEQIRKIFNKYKYAEINAL